MDMDPAIGPTWKNAPIAPAVAARGIYARFEIAGAASAGPPVGAAVFAVSPAGLAGVHADLSPAIMSMLSRTMTLCGLPSAPVNVK